MRWTVLGEISGHIMCSQFPKHIQISLVDSIMYSIELHIHSFDIFSWMVSFTIPSKVDFFVCTGVACCVCLIFSMVNLIGSPTLELCNNALTSDSDYAGITFFMIFDRVMTAPLDSLLLLKICDPNKKCPPVQLIAGSS